jgi:hypothetical protein
MLRGKVRMELALQNIGCFGGSAWMVGVVWRKAGWSLRLRLRSGLRRSGTHPSAGATLKNFGAS